MLQLQNYIYTLITDNALVRYSPEICELSGVINHKTSDFISTLLSNLNAFVINMKIIKELYNFIVVIHRDTVMFHLIQPSATNKDFGKPKYFRHLK